MDAIFGLTILILLCFSILYLMFGIDPDEQQQECEDCDKQVCDGACNESNS